MVWRKLINRGSIINVGIEFLSNSTSAWVFYVLLNAVEWKSTLLGVILGSLRFGVEFHAKIVESTPKQWFEALF